MSLFQKSVLNKYLKEQDKIVVNEAFERYKSYFHNTTIQQNIRESKEEQFQEGFLRELFVKILGYTLNPNPEYNLTTEFKNQTGAKKADGAILKEGKAVGVIELKSTKTKDLETVRQQAFDYKANQEGCVYVITSNFEKLRFYINNAVEYEEFNLFGMTPERFSLLYLCLEKDKLLADIPLKIKDASLLEEANITKQFYKDYSVFKRELFGDLIENNLDLTLFEGMEEKDIKLLLYKKSQKLIDRFLFIFFAEDRGLLPPNSISLVIQQWEKLIELDEYQPLYDRYKKYFGYMNTGFKGKQYDVYAYNGGLFEPDEILNSIKIDDELLKRHTAVFSAYDFDTEVDVNILGHIFENSLSEIEEVTAQLSGEEVDKKSTKRKKEGVFYTPKYITQYIVDNTVGKLCEEKKAELGIDEEEFTPNRQKATKKRLLSALEEYRKWLLELTICDPACGSGAFLNQALDSLIKEHRYVDELNASLFDSPIVFEDVENQILENNIFGVDINEESVDIARLSLWLRTAKKGRKLTTLNENIKCGNSLIDDPEVAGDKAFKWEEEFPDVFAKGGFDVVIGNPPYVFAREKISQEEKDYYSKHYNSADYQVNTYLLFIERSIDLLINKGVYGLIIPNAWLMIYSGKGLRKYILNTCNIDQIINLEGYSFDGVNVETIIILAKKGKVDNNELDIYLSKEKEFKFSHNRNQFDFLNNEGFEFRVFSDDLSKELTENIYANSELLDDVSTIKAGLKAYEAGKGAPKQSREDVKKRPFDFDYKFDENTHKYLEGKNVGRYFLSHSGDYLQYGKHLAAPRTFDLFDGEKIIIREITGKYPKSIIATFTKDVYLFNMSNIAIVPKKRSNLSLKYILALLNSSLIAYYFLKNTAKSVRKMFPKIILKDLRKFPIKNIDSNKQKPFIEKVDKMLILNNEFQNIKVPFIVLLQNKFTIDKMSKKLQNWDKLDFRDFLKELKKTKIQLSLSEEAGWMQYFNEQKQKAQELKTEIDRTDKEIDRMVYELYGLTEKEIGIVEES